MQLTTNNSTQASDGNNLTTRLRIRITSGTWFSLNQWFAIALLTCGIVFSLQIIDWPTTAPNISSLIPQSPLEVTVFIAAIIVCAKCVIVGDKLFRRWSKNPFPSWIDVIIIASAFGFTCAAILDARINTRIACAVLGASFVLIQQAKLSSLLAPDTFSADARADIDDAPLSDFRNEDDFERAAFKNSLLESIKERSTSRSRVVALTGPWGAGKTTLLKAVYSDLEKGTRLWIDPWQYRQTGRLIEILITAIATKVKAHVLCFSTNRLVRQYAGIFSPVAGKAKDAVQEAAKLLCDKDETESLKTELDLAIQASNKHFVVFLDDLERLTADDIHNVLKAVRLAVAIPNITYVLAYDRERIVKDENISAEFLDKIVDEEFDVPAPSEQQFLCYLRRHLKIAAQSYLPTEHKLATDFDTRWIEVEAALAKVLDTPRKIKKNKNGCGSPNQQNATPCEPNGFFADRDFATEISTALRRY